MRGFDVPKRKLIEEMDKIYKRAKGDVKDKEDSRNSLSMKHLKEDEFDASKTWHLLIEDIKNENPVFKFFLATVEGDLATKCLGLVTLAKPLERNASLKLANW